MLQRPGCFIFVLIAAFIAMAVAQNYVSSITSAAPAVARAGLASPSAIPMTATVDGLATQGASVAATAGVIATQQAGTQTQAILGTAGARTATADAWTATAVSAAETLTAAEIQQALLQAQVLAGTLTAVPPALTETQAARWSTANADSTRSAVVATIDRREADQAAVVDDALYIATLALIVGGALIILGGLAWVVVALSWRVQGKAGGEAQAAVLSVQTRAPIPTTTGGQPAAPLDPHTRTERLALRVLGRMAGLSGEDSATLTSAPEFGDNRSRDKVAAALCAAGLAESVNGVGVQLLDGWTIGELAEAIAGGSITLDDPPTPANVG